MKKNILLLAIFVGLYSYVNVRASDEQSIEIMQKKIESMGKEIEAIAEKMKERQPLEEKDRQRRTESVQRVQREIEAAQEERKARLPLEEEYRQQQAENLAKVNALNETLKRAVGLVEQKPSDREQVETLATKQENPITLSIVPYKPQRDETKNKLQISSNVLRGILKQSNPSLDQAQSKQGPTQQSLVRYQPSPQRSIGVLELEEIQKLPLKQKEALDQVLTPLQQEIVTTKKPQIIILTAPQIQNLEHILMPKQIRPALEQAQAESQQEEARANQTPTFEQREIQKTERRAAQEQREIDALREVEKSLTTYVDLRKTEQEALSNLPSIPWYKRYANATLIWLNGGIETIKASNVEEDQKTQARAAQEQQAELEAEQVKRVKLAQALATQETEEMGQASRQLEHTTEAPGVAVQNQTALETEYVMQTPPPKGWMAQIR